VYLKHPSPTSQTRIEALKQTVTFLSQNVDILLVSTPLLFIPKTWLPLATNPTRTRTPNHIGNLPNQGNNIPVQPHAPILPNLDSNQNLTLFFIRTQHHVYAIWKPSPPHALFSSLSIPYDILERLDLNLSQSLAPIHHRLYSHGLNQHLHMNNKESSYPSTSSHQLNLHQHTIVSHTNRNHLEVINMKQSRNSTKTTRNWLKTGVCRSDSWATRSNPPDTSGLTGAHCPVWPAT
jgi:hypothetical protein